MSSDNYSVGVGVLGATGYILSKVFRSKWIFNVSDLWLDSAVDLGAISDGISFRILKKFEDFLMLYSGPTALH